ncbi:hypothetical protein PA10_00150 [Pseudomonas phage pPa_SNUABM_DT01]|nr:hypothetical protein PA10_00150 [Pseudomonas phage pPa_SNUABM_DT01]
MARVVPVLGSAGFATDLTIKADEALSNFYLSQRSQSDLYRGSIASLGEIISAHGNNPPVLESETRKVLQGYFERQFEEVTLDVKSVVKGPSIDLQISVILRDGDKSIDIAHVVSSSDSKIRSIIDLQNEGRPFISADLLST